MSETSKYHHDVPADGGWYKDKLYWGDTLINKIWDLIIEANPGLSGLNREHFEFNIRYDNYVNPNEVTLEVSIRNKFKKNYSNRDKAYSFTYTLIDSEIAFKKLFPNVSKEYAYDQVRDVENWFKTIGLNRASIISDNGKEKVINFHSIKTYFHINEDERANRKYMDNDTSDINNFDKPNIIGTMSLICFMDKNGVTVTFKQDIDQVDLPDITNTNINLTLENITPQNGGGAQSQL